MKEGDNKLREDKDVGGLPLLTGWRIDEMGIKE